MADPGIYEHFKGRRYRVICTALHSETKEPLVVYEALYENHLSPLWVRPQQMFEETVEANGQRVLRFKRIKEDEPPPI